MFRLAVVDWPPIQQMHTEFDLYVGGVLRVQSGESLTMACLKAGLGEYKNNLTQPDRQRLIAFMRAFLLVAAAWLVGVHVAGDDGEAWSVDHGMPLSKWIDSHGYASIIHIEAPLPGVCETLFRIITPVRLIERLDDGSALCCVET